MNVVLAPPPHARTYRYDAIDREFLDERIAEFTAQIERRLREELPQLPLVQSLEWPLSLGQ